MQTDRSYLAIAAVVAIVLSSFAAAVNFVVDPYGIFDLPVSGNRQWVKPEVVNHLREIKVRKVTQVQPEGLILGASTSEVGLDPLHPGWEAARVYNLAVGQGSISGAHQFLLHAAQTEMPRKVILGVDLSMFNPAIQKMEGIIPASLAVDEEGQPNTDFAKWNYYLPAWSIAMLQSSIKSVIATWRSLDENSADIGKLPIDENGMLRPENFVTQSWKGHRERFQNRISEHIEKFWAPVDEFRAIQDIRNSPPFDAYMKIVRFACENDIKLYIVISPVHAYMAEAMQVAGLTGLWESWKRAIVIEGEAEAGRSGCEPFPIWDFSGYNEITAEAISTSVSPADDPHWYWDPVHYRKVVGDKVLDRIFERDSDSGFGIRLNSANIEGHLADTALRGEAYRNNHPDEVQLIAETVYAAIAASEPNQK